MRHFRFHIFFSLLSFSGFAYAQPLISNPDFTFLNDYPLQKLPYRESVETEFASQGTLSAAQKEALYLNELLGAESAVHIKYRLPVSARFHAIVFGYVDASQNPYALLVTYSADFKLVTSQVLAYTIPGEPPTVAHSQVDVARFGTTITKRPRAWYSMFMFGHKGEIIERTYKTPEALIQEQVLIERRVVKAKNGLIVRDEAGNKIGKFDYAQEVYVLSYAPDSFAIVDGGRKIWGQKTKVILDFETFVDQLHVPDTTPTTGYIFSGYLYKNYQLDYRPITNAEIDADDLYRYYYTNGIWIGENWTEANVDIRQFMTIERVALSKYRNKVVLKDSVETNVYTVYKDGMLELPLENGKMLRLKDTVYISSEYSPSLHHELYKSPQLPKNYLVNRSFFEDSNFLIFDKTNGDTAATFIDYPFISPQKTVAISFTAPVSYDEGTALMQLQTIRSGEFRAILNAEFIGWNIPNKRVVYWLSDTSFILKAKEVEDNYSNEENAKFFYLKFTLK